MNKVGEIKAQIIERDGEIWMVKDCPKHGKIEDMMAIDVEVPGTHRKELPGPRHSMPTTTRLCTITAAAPLNMAAARS